MLFHFHNLSHFQKIEHFVSARAGGVSLLPYNSLNLGLHTTDKMENVLRNRTLLAKTIGLSEDKFIYCKQIHSGSVTLVNETDIVQGCPQFVPETDALVTALHGICLTVMVADCVPVLLYDTKNQVIAAIHAGWRGTVQHIVDNTLKSMMQHYGSSPENIIAGIGPSIGPCCYEVGEEVIAEVQHNFGTTEGYLKQVNGSMKPYFDLWYANRQQLLNNGIKPENIETVGDCTKCQSDIYFSARAGKGITGRFAAGIYLK